jgi:S1-C subfamily serine protease
VVASPGAPSTAVPSAGISDPAIIAATTSEQPIDELFARVEESIVRVNVSTPEGTGNGSGFVAHSSGIVVTNYHVVENATKAWVEFSNKERIPVDGYLYLNHKKDIAVLKFDPTQRRSGLKSIPVAAEFPRKGVAVVAIGAPLGLDMSVTEGVVSAVRTVQELELNIGLRGHDGTWVQTTAAISPGNSGGPLMNKRGEVVAINTLTYTGDNAQALNFGISCGDINQAMKELRAAPMPVSPLSTPKYDISGVQDRSPGEDIIDVSGKPEGQQRLAALEKLTIAFLPLTFEDPFDVVVSSVRSEARNVLRKLKIDEILINDDKSVLLILMTLENAGGKLTLFITAHILVQDDSSGRPQVLKLWEKTGEVGTTSRQAILQGTLSPNLAKKIDAFFAELRADVLAARKAQANPATPASPN